MKQNLLRSAMWTAGVLMLVQIVTGCGITRSEYENMLKLEEAEKSDLTLKQLVQKMSEATDPKGAFAGAKTYLMRQRVVSVKNAGKNSTKDEYALEIKYKAPDCLRSVSMRDGKPFSTLVFNKDRAWYELPPNKVVDIPQGTDLNLVKAFMDMLRPGTTVDEIFPEVQLGVVYSGREKFYRLICYTSDKNIAPYVMYVDGKTFLSRKLETILYAADGSTHLYQSIVESYRWMSDVRMPVISIVNTGKQSDISTVTDFVLNPDIPDSEFEKTQAFSY